MGWIDSHVPWDVNLCGFKEPCVNDGGPGPPPTERGTFKGWHWEFPIWCWAALLTVGFPCMSLDRTFVALLWYLNWKLKPRSFLDTVRVQNLGLFGWMFLWTIEVTPLWSCQFRSFLPAKLGYFKTLFVGKLACRNTRALKTSFVRVLGGNFCATLATMKQQQYWRQCKCKYETVCFNAV